MRPVDDYTGAAPVSPFNPFPNYAPNPAGSKLLPAGPKTVPSAAAANPNKYKVPTKPAAPKSSGKVGTSAGGSIAPVAAAAPAPSGPPDINTYLAGDDAYKAQELALKSAMDDYMNQYNLQNDQYGTTYKQNTDALKKNRELSETALTDDYASRGLMNSGIFTKAFTDLGSDYNNRQLGLDTDKANFVSNLGLALQNFQKDQGTQKDKAYQDAINRRAAQFSL